MDEKTLYDEIMALQGNFRVDKEKAIMEKITKAHIHGLMTPKIEAAIAIMQMHMIERDYNDFNAAKKLALPLLKKILSKKETDLDIYDIVNLIYFFHYSPDYREMARFLLDEAEKHKDNKLYKSIRASIYLNTLFREARTNTPCATTTRFHYEAIRKICRGRQSGTGYRHLTDTQHRYKAIAIIRNAIIRKKLDNYVDTYDVREGFEILRKQKEHELYKMMIAEVIDFGFFDNITRESDLKHFSDNVGDNAINFMIGIELGFLCAEKEIYVADAAQFVGIAEEETKLIFKGLAGIGNLAPAFARLFDVSIAEIYKSADVVNKSLLRRGKKGVYLSEVILIDESGLGGDVENVVVNEPTVVYDYTNDDDIDIDDIDDDDDDYGYENVDGEEVEDKDNKGNDWLFTMTVEDDEDVGYKDDEDD